MTMRKLFFKNCIIFLSGAILLSSCRDDSSKEEHQLSNGKDSVNTIDSTKIKDAKPINEIKLALLDTRYEKAELLLGKPDEEEDMGYWSKSYMIYFNRVIDNDGVKKHLILFIRKKDTSSKYTSSFFKVIEEIHVAKDGERVCFGIHCITM
jgi:hypothetical protein